MSAEYPCVYYDNRHCTKFTEPGYESWCVEGPCSHETPSNADHFRRMSDEDMARLLHGIWVCGANGEENFSDEKDALDFLKHPYKGGL